MITARTTLQPPQRGHWKPSTPKTCHRRCSRRAAAGPAPAGSIGSLAAVALRQPTAAWLRRRRRRDHLVTPCGARREDAMIEDHVGVRRWNESGEALHQLQVGQPQTRCPVGPRPLEPQHHAAAGGLLDAALRQGWAARPPHVKGTRRWWSQAVPCKSAKPLAKEPHRTNVSSSRRTKPGTVRPWASAASSRRGSWSRTTRRSSAPPGVEHGPRRSTVQVDAGGAARTGRAQARTAPTEFQHLALRCSVSVDTPFDTLVPGGLHYRGVVPWRLPLLQRPRQRDKVIVERRQPAAGCLREGLQVTHAFFDSLHLIAGLPGEFVHAVQPGLHLLAPPRDRAGPGGRRRPRWSNLLRRLKCWGRSQLALGRGPSHCGHLFVELGVQLLAPLGHPPLAAGDGPAGVGAVRGVGALRLEGAAAGVVIRYGYHHHEPNGPTYGSWVRWSIRVQAVDVVAPRARLTVGPGQP